MDVRMDGGEAPPEQMLWVKSSSSAASVASKISTCVLEGKRVTLRAIGAGAVNQAMKAIAVANSFVAPRGIILDCRPGFTPVIMPDGAEITALVFRLLVH